jgi:hypothetical protein
VDFIAKLVALVPKPGVNLTRFHGVFAPNSKHRALVTPAKRVKRQQAQSEGWPGGANASSASCGHDRFLLLQNPHTCHPWQQPQ